MSASVKPTPSSAALPRWVKDAIATISKARGYVVTTTGGEFVLKVHPATPCHRLLQQHQQHASTRELDDHAALAALVSATSARTTRASRARRCTASAAGTTTAS